jgi:hypothetical protein
VDPGFELLGDTPVRLPRDRSEPELLEADPRELWRPPRRLVLVVLVVVVGVLLGVLAWYADGRARAEEGRALATCRHQLHNAVISADLELVSVADDLRPTLASTTGAERDAAVARLSHPARRLLADVIRADRLCRSVSIRPWHSSLRAGRDAATAYSAALATKLRAVVADGDNYFRDDRSLRRLRRAADLAVFGGRY